VEEEEEGEAGSLRRDTPATCHLPETTMKEAYMVDRRSRGGRGGGGGRGALGQVVVPARGEEPLRDGGEVLSTGFGGGVGG
jgi:hypothetical protein